MAAYVYAPPQAQVRPVSRPLAVWTQIVLWCTAVSFVIDPIAVANLRGAADRFYKAFGSTPAS